MGAGVWLIDWLVGWLLRLGWVGLVEIGSPPAAQVDLELLKSSLASNPSTGTTAMSHHACGFDWVK